MLDVVQLASEFNKKTEQVSRCRYPLVKQCMLWRLSGIITNQSMYLPSAPSSSDLQVQHGGHFVDPYSSSLAQMTVVL